MKGADSQLNAFTLAESRGKAERHYSGLQMNATDYFGVRRQVAALG